jgi:hypothetical protein
MPKVQKVLTLRMGPSKTKGAPEGTLERHLDVQDLPKLLAEGWQMVETSPPDEEGNATIILEREEP